MKAFPDAVLRAGNCSEGHDLEPAEVVGGPASEQREENLGDNLLEKMRRAQRKAWQLLDTAESEGHHRGAIMALREVRECLESLVSRL